jgi:hypothetical protein
MRAFALDPEPAEVIVELVTRNERRADPAGNRPQLACSDKSADFVLRATKLG